MPLEKETLLVMSNFSFSHSVFKGVVDLTTIFKKHIKTRACLGKHKAPFLQMTAHIDIVAFLSLLCLCKYYRLFSYLLRDEALKFMEEQQRKKEEKLQDEMEEYQESRKHEKKAMEDEIEELKRKKVT